MQRSKGIDALIKYLRPDANATLQAQTSKETNAATNARQAADAAAARAQSERHFKATRDDAARAGTVQTLDDGSMVVVPTKVVPGQPVQASPILSGGAPVKGKQPAGGNATESERTAGFLLQRIRDSQRQLASATEADPDSAKPGLAQEALRKVGGETAANAITGENRQKVEAAQLDILDAALTLGTGAAYTREQLQGYRKSYFPQIGDKPANVKEKAERLQNLIRAAEVKAGRAAKDTGQPVAATQVQSGTDLGGGFRVK